MPSLQSRLFLFMLRHAHLFQFQLKRLKAIDHTTSIPQLREDTGRTVRMLGKLPKGIEVVPTTIGPMHAEWVRPTGKRLARAILYLHGGGYVIGDSKSHRAIVAKVVRGSATGALLFDYRLAPEHPFPAALDDAVAAYEWLLQQGIAASSIAFMGDSAGGGLCLATLIALRDRGIPLPAGAVALSPWTDLACSGATYVSKIDVEPLAWKDSWTVFSEYYVGDKDPCLPLISPLYGDLRGLPPILIQVGENEVLLDDSIGFARNAEAAGVDVTLKISEGMFHCFPLCAPIFPEATAAMDEICAFIRTRIGK